MEVRSLYGYDADKVSKAAALVCLDKSLTVQDQAEEADINVLVERFGITGQLPQKVRMPTYGDFSGVGDYQSALNAIKAAEESFLAMPAKVRSRFNNDPAEFVDFCSDPANLEEAKALGLVDSKEKVNGEFSGKAGGGAEGASGAAAENGG